MWLMCVDSMDSMNRKGGYISSYIGWQKFTIYCSYKVGKTVCKYNFKWPVFNDSTVVPQLKV
jgi:hypothetical protein